jgi:hypothetical protein
MPDSSTSPPPRSTRPCSTCRGTPLDVWPDDAIATLPKGISRHLVRFAHLSGYVIAIKETSGEMARGEYEMLRTLQRMDIPCVDPLAVITNRHDENGSPLDPVLVTRHLKFSLPYRALYCRPCAPTPPSGSSTRSPSCSCGSTSSASTGATCRFRTRCSDVTPAPLPRTSSTPRPASCTRAGSNGQRENDLEVARVNIAGELLDLEAGGRLDDNLDAVDVSNGIVAKYRSLWTELTGSETSRAPSAGASTTVSSDSTTSGSTSRSSPSRPPRAARR